MREVVQEWCVAAFERLEREGGIREGALLPTPREEADPFACQGASSGLVGFALVALLLGEDACPEGMPDRCSGPLHEGLAHELRTLEAPVHPGLLAAPFGHRCDPGIFL